jgi:myo-inositol-1(or 4)-monophosphatase
MVRTAQSRFLELEQTLDECRRLILDARELSVHQKLRDDGVKETVTAIDLAVETKLLGRIDALFEGTPVVAEETRNFPALLEEDLCFVVDPIDGTHEFVEGRDGYAVCVALLQRGTPVMALVDFPARSQRYRAERGAGSTLNGSPISLVTRPAPRNLSIAVSPRQFSDARFQAVRRRIQGAIFTPQGGLASKLVDVSAGKFDAGLFLDWPGSRAPAWDFAAAGLVLQEAGGVFTSLDGVSLLDPVPALNLGGWLAGGVDCHETILRQLR